jgi:hypothetical protein
LLRIGQPEANGRGGPVGVEANQHHVARGLDCGRQAVATVSAQRWVIYAQTIVDLKKKRKKQRRINKIMIFFSRTENSNNMDGKPQK